MILSALTHPEVLKLRQLAHTTRDARTLRRCLGLLQLNAGSNAKEVAQTLLTSRQSIYSWIREYSHRMEGLQEQLKLDPGGRPSVWDDENTELLESLLCHSPDHLGYRSQIWTIPLIQSHFLRFFGEEVSRSTLRRMMHDLGYVWKRPRYVLAPDPKRSLKMAEIKRKIANLDKDTEVLFMDETDLLLFPPLRSAWTIKGMKAKVELSGSNEKRVIFGAINIATGNRVLMSRERLRIQDFQFFLKTIKWYYRRWKVLLILDQHPSHTSSQNEVLARSLGIEFAWLPARSPELNPLESLWGKTKDKICANRQYEDLDEQVDEFISYIQDLSPATALRQAGILSKHFWLKKL